MHNTGIQVFQKIFGDYATAYELKLRARAYGLKDEAIFFAFSEFYANEKSLSLRVRLLATIASLVAQNSFLDFKAYVVGALHVGCKYSEVEQVILQMSAYAGNPKMLNAMKVLEEVRQN